MEALDELGARFLATAPSVHRHNEVPVKVDSPAFHCATFEELRAYIEQRDVQPLASETPETPPLPPPVQRNRDASFTSDDSTHHTLSVPSLSVPGLNLGSTSAVAAPQVPRRGVLRAAHVTQEQRPVASKGRDSHKPSTARSKKPTVVKKQRATDPAPQQCSECQVWAGKLKAARRTMASERKRRQALEARVAALLDKVASLTTQRDAAVHETSQLSRQLTTATRCTASLRTALKAARQVRCTVAKAGGCDAEATVPAPKRKPRKGRRSKRKPPVQAPVAAKAEASLRIPTVTVQGSPSPAKEVVSIASDSDSDGGTGALLRAYRRRGTAAAPELQQSFTVSSPSDSDSDD